MGSRESRARWRRAGAGNGDRSAQVRSLSHPPSLPPFGQDFWSSPARDTAKRLAAIRKLRKQGVGINKIARKLGIGVSVVQRVVSGGASHRNCKD